MDLFIPKMYLKDIFSIDYKKLINLGYKLIIFDLDNTIGRIDEEICSKETTDFLNALNKKIKIVVASNSLKSRVSKFCQNLSCDYFYLSLKPTTKVIKKISKKYQVDYKDMVIVGDQVVTDILAGNRLNLMTILVDKIGENDLKITGFNRKLEGYLNKKNNIKKGRYYEKK